MNTRNKTETPKPKHAREPSNLELICIRQNNAQDGLINNAPAVTLMQDKIREYCEKIGSESPHLFGIMIQLLTHGKVRVEFRDHTERLQLKNMDDRLPRAQAIEWMDQYLYKQDRDEDDFNSTHRIVIPRLLKN
ncbi:MAG: hypothetical protein PHP44_05695 [Kiritimatiellae bacterium]|nr:hypothetical protein [Kiritimatiellia bacterium]